MNYIDSEHLVQWVDSGRASIASAKVCAGFHDFLLELSWRPTQLNWEEIEHDTLDLTELGDADLVTLVRRYPVGVHPYVLTMFTPDQPGLICRTEDAIANLDHIYWKAPGFRYFCGVDVSADGGWACRHEDFGEFDGFARLTLPVP
ncbi:hypothetical protein [Streptomyces sp. NPDC005538]|uniref:hypothetical protein n=1 Tax=unclassified Streptomyces TaxID=2593676 RepID=UPI0033ACD452